KGGTFATGRAIRRKPPIVTRRPILDQKPGLQISNRTPLLDRINVPADLRRLPEADLRQVADELRAELIDAVSITGGHFGAGLGVAVARDFKGEKRNVIAVIGDGAMSAGMAYEAMNNAGSMDSRLIVILNDNDMSIAPPVGAMSAYLSRVLSSKSFMSLRHLAGEAARHLPRRL